MYIHKFYKPINVEIKFEMQTMFMHEQATSYFIDAYHISDVYKSIYCILTIFSYSTIEF